MFAREELVFPENMIAGIDWILPDRPLAPELATVLEAGYLRGAELWHVANALYLTRLPERLAFATLDSRQGAVAAAVGFRILGETGDPERRS